MTNRQPLSLPFPIAAIHVRSYSASVMNELDTNYRKYFPLIFHYSDDVANDTRKLDSITDIFKCHYFGQKNVSADIQAFSNVSKTQN